MVWNNGVRRLAVVFAWTLALGCGQDGDVTFSGAGSGDSGTDAAADASGGTGGLGAAGFPGAGGTSGRTGGGAGTSAAGFSGSSGTAGGAGHGAQGGSGGGSAGTGGAPVAVDCSGIKAHPDFELCKSGKTFCEGVFTKGNGCVSFCASAGLVCTERHGGEPGCQGPEADTQPCDANNGHMSDWCRCEKGPGTGGSSGAGGSSSCPSDPHHPPVERKMHYTKAAFTNRSAWVLTCRDYAYTAFQAEHEACDPNYHHGSGKGTATFTFRNVPKGMYKVYFQGRHTPNRNPQGALVIVSSGGQSWSKRINQRDNAGYPMDLHGTYCLSGTVTVVLDSTTTASDSVQNVYLRP